jgi:rSAM/selenodomain-associated transferase 2
LSVTAAGSGPEPPTLSIIIPTLNEALIIADTLRRLASQEGDCELLVVDNGSTDGTAALASPLARTITSPPGRGAALNAGAEASRGDLLLFLHADTCLPPGALPAIIRAMADPAVVGGCFSVEFDGGGWEPRLAGCLYGLFARAGFFYGDAAIFLRRDAMRRLGGVRPLPMMEDLDLCVRMRRLGRTVRLPDRVVSSGRRWRGQGFLRTAAVYLAVQGLYLLGIRHPRLFRLYRPVR